MHELLVGAILPESVPVAGGATVALSSRRTWLWRRYAEAPKESLSKETQRGLFFI